MLALRWSLLMLGAFVVVIFQTSASSSFPIFGVAPQLALVVLCCGALVRPTRETLTLIPLMGVGIGLLAYQGMPESVGALAPIGIAALSWHRWRQTSGRVTVATEWVAVILLTGLATILHFAAHAIAVELATSGADWLDALQTVLLRSTIGNMMLAAIVFWLVRLPSGSWSEREARRRSAYSS